jgi:hypothetical protein
VIGFGAIAVEQMPAAIEIVAATINDVIRDGTRVSRGRARRPSA